MKMNGTLSHDNAAGNTVATSHRMRSQAERSPRRVSAVPRTLPSTPRQDFLDQPVAETVAIFLSSMVVAV
jgi:hypothetical protein